MKQVLKDRGGKTALVVIDVQNGVVEGGHDVDGVVGRIAQMVDHARATAVPVIFVQHEDEELVRDSEKWKLRNELQPRGDEPVISKHYPDTFAETNFEETLERLGIGHLVIAGAQTDACVQTTQIGALRDGYDVTLVTDAHTTSSWATDNYASDAADTIARINTSAPFIQFPNATSSVATTDDILKR